MEYVDSDACAGLDYHKYAMQEHSFDNCETVSIEYVDSGVRAGLDYHKYAMQERSFDNCETVSMEYVDSGVRAGLDYHKYAMQERSFDNCETVSMEYVDSGVRAGLDYHNYAMPESSYDNSSVSEDNTCFCHGRCMWGGVMNVSACRFGSPAFLSLPHFLYADASLRAGKLGVPLDVAARFQFNVFIEPSEYVA
ncbi:Cameo2 [Operophtera brumata]|uniref:Scavenger receptor class B member 1 n=1 Tax=Operophtera brumata TaxID=104452 RepID=A0A0L7LMQ8_OPEBR|nr:Cameo2 [Operophtera brumata]